VDAAAPRERPYYLSDAGPGGIPGFAVRVWPTGRKSFVLRYRPGGRATPETVQTIGEHGPFTVEQARAVAQQLRADVTAARLDPTRAPQARRARAQAAHREAREAVTVAELFDRFLADRERHGTKPGTLDGYRRLLGAPVRKLGAQKGAAIAGPVRAALGAKKAKDVTSRDVRALYDAHRDAKPAAARRMVKLIQTVYRFGADEELVPRDLEPWRGVRLAKPGAPRRAALSRDEYAALGAALDTAEREGLPVAPAWQARGRGVSAARKAKATGRTRGPYRRTAPAAPRPQNPVLVACLRFLAVTGWRRSEAKGLRWDALDAERRTARLEETKTGRSERPLGRAAWVIIDAQRALQRALGIDTPFVFPQLENPTRPVAEVTHVWSHARHAAGLALTLHGLRHAFTTVARELGYGDHVIAAVIGHQLGSSQTSRYGLAPGDVVAEAADRTGAAIADRLAGRAPAGAQVLPLRPAADPRSA
jgi:integrase